MRRICIDFDGVIHKYSKGWQGGKIYDDPMPGAKEALEKLQKEYELVIFTTRKETSDVSMWMAKNGLPNLAVTNEKLPAIAYIDDRAVRFTNWEDISKLYV
jgi:5'(3')-deoxyribonucleotidase